MMDAHLSFSITLLVSLALWWGSMRATLNGDLDLTASGLRFVLAFMLARTAVGLVNHLLTGYHRNVRQPDTRGGSIGEQGSEPDAAWGDLPAKSVSDVGNAPNRRRTDQVPTLDATLDSGPTGNSRGVPPGLPEEDVGAER